MTAFASQGAQAEHYLAGIGRFTDAVGRVIRERMRRLRPQRRPLSREANAIRREAMRGRDILRAHAERTRVYVGRPVF